MQEYTYYKRENTEGDCVQFVMIPSPQLQTNLAIHLNYTSSGCQTKLIEKGSWEKMGSLEEQEFSQVARAEIEQAYPILSFCLELGERMLVQQLKAELMEKLLNYVQVRIQLLQA